MLRVLTMRSFAVAATSATAPAYAADANSGDTAWMLTSTALVLFMTIPGLSLFYAGLVRSKNALSVLAQCFGITCIVSILWLVFGYSLAFSNGAEWNGFLGGLSKFGLIGISRADVQGTIPETVYLMFQLTFAIITPALIVGAFAERMKFSAMLGFVILWLTVVYLPVCHWVWGGGWLAQKGLLDYAGGTVVHTTAGVAALVCALVLGRRQGFPEQTMAPHNLSMAVTGTGMLWVGWFGFNAGSAVAAGGDAGMAMLATHMSASAGALTWMAMEWIKIGKPSVLGMVTGAVAGLATITPASGYVGPLAALVIGISAGVACYLATGFFKRVLKIDDSLDVFPVHGVGGMLGTVLAGVFVDAALGGAGLREGFTTAKQVGVQFIGVAATALWAGGASFLLLKLLGAAIGLRVSDETETEGLDLTEHGEQAYS